MNNSQADEIADFKHSLYFMKVGELKIELEKLNLTTNGKKDDLVKRIFCKITNTKEEIKPKIPSISIAKHGIQYPLEENTLILKGAYKNDAKTREFLRKLIGENFHFTVFGMDWINERWLEGKPPSYREFADFWVNENKKYSGIQKDTLQLNNFVRNISKSQPNISRDEVMKKWNEERNSKVIFARNYIAKHKNN